MSEIIRRSFGVQFKAAKDDARSVDVVASTDAVDSYGEVLVQDWNLERYKNNPIVLYGHNSWDMPIGYAKDVSVEGGKLLATLVFVDEKATPMAERVWQGIKQGSLRAVSVGFRSKRATMQQLDGKDIFVLSGNELVEISVVPLPANPDAIIETQAKSLESLRSLVKASAPAPATNPIDQATSDAGVANGDSMSLPIIATILSLAATATEAEVVEGVKSAKSNAERAERERAAVEAELFKATGADSREKALGVIAGWKAAAGEVEGLKADVAKKQSDLDARDRDALISKAKGEGRLSPAMEKSLEGKSLEFVKSFVEIVPVIPNLAPNAKAAAGTEKTEEAQETVALGDKKWEELKPMQKAALHEENRPLYDALKGDFERRTGKKIG